MKKDIPLLIIFKTFFLFTVGQSLQDLAKNISNSDPF